MPGRKLHGLAILDLSRGKDAIKEALAEPLERTIDPRSFDDVDANPDDAHPR